MKAELRNQSSESCGKRADPMTQVSIQQATEQLSSLIEAALHGEEVVIMQGDAPAVRLMPLVKTEPSPLRQARFGSGKGLLRFMAADFDSPLEDLKEYME